MLHSNKRGVFWSNFEGITQRRKGDTQGDTREQKGVPGDTPKNGDTGVRGHTELSCDSDSTKSVSGVPKMGEGVLSDPHYYNTSNTSNYSNHSFIENKKINKETTSEKNLPKTSKKSKSEKDQQLLFEVASTPPRVPPVPKKEIGESDTVYHGGHFYALKQQFEKDFKEHFNWDYVWDKQDWGCLKSFLKIMQNYFEAKILFHWYFRWDDEWVQCHQHLYCVRHILAITPALRQWRWDEFGHGSWAPGVDTSTVSLRSMPAKYYISQLYSRKKKTACQEMPAGLI